MSCVQLAFLFLVGTAHLSSGKICPGCIENAEAGQADYDYLSAKLKDLKTGLPKGMEGEESIELVRVNSVRKQVVSGLKYYYDFEARGLPSKRLYDCSLVVVRRAWTGEDNVSGFSCSASSNGIQGTMLGGEVDIDVTNNKNLKGLGNLIGQGVGKVQGSKHLMRVVKYIKATKQVVAGTIIRATVEVARTDCDLNENVRAEDCQLKTEGRQVCEVQVWLKPWMKVKEVTHVQCRPHPEFCAGCPVQMDPSDTVIQQCLKRTLSNLNAQPHSSQKLSLVRIKKATSQVIAGVKYTVDFDAKDGISGKSLSCSAVIILQPWISENPVVEDFKCNPDSRS